LVATLRPKTVHGLVISATVGSFSQKSDEDKKRFLAERIEPLKAGKPFRETAKAVVDSMFAPGSSGPLVELVREVALSTASETFIQAIAAIVQYRGEETLPQVKVPTLLMAGAYDAVGRPEGMRNIQRQFIPHAQFHELPNSGHYGFAEEPELFNQHLLAFIRQVQQALAQETTCAPPFSPPLVSILLRRSVGVAAGCVLPWARWHWPVLCLCWRRPMPGRAGRSS
jgi:pimeloyl-ACP methyl ester carboxylesterase